mmetsp:Transcript_4788/g.15569  ORF Transcript_4788/g.15569 Transcript_4788/m.15569 type:complete len:380 (+) Transcript_4788:388-1527(+)
MKNPPQETGWDGRGVGLVQRALPDAVPVVWLAEQPVVVARRRAAAPHLALVVRRDRGRLAAARLAAARLGGDRPRRYAVGDRDDARAVVQLQLGPRGRGGADAQGLGASPLRGGRRPRPLGACARLRALASRLRRLLPPVRPRLPQPRRRRQPGERVRAVARAAASLVRLPRVLLRRRPAHPRQRDARALQLDARRVRLARRGGGPRRLGPPPLLHAHALRRGQLGHPPRRHRRRLARAQRRSQLQPAGGGSLRPRCASRRPAAAAAACIAARRHPFPRRASCAATGVNTSDAGTASKGIDDCDRDGADAHPDTDGCTAATATSDAAADAHGTAAADVGWVPARSRDVSSPLLDRARAHARGGAAAARAPGRPRAGRVV